MAVGNLDVPVSTRASQGTVNVLLEDTYNLLAGVAAIEAKFDALDLGNLDAPVSTRASQSSVDALGAELDAIQNNIDTRASQGTVNVLLDDTFNLLAATAAIEAKLDALDFSSLASQESVDYVTDALALLEIKADTIEARQILQLEGINAIADAVDFALDAGISTRASQFSVDAIEAKLDALDLSNLDETVSSRASQVSLERLGRALLEDTGELGSGVAAIEAKLDSLEVGDASQESVDAIEAKLDQLAQDVNDIQQQVSSAGAKPITIEVSEVKSRERYLVQTSIGGDMVSASLTRLTGMNSKNNKETEITDLTEYVSITSLSNGVLDVEIDLPKRIGTMRYYHMVWSFVDGSGATHTGYTLFNVFGDRHDD